MSGSTLAFLICAAAAAAGAAAAKPAETCYDVEWRTLLRTGKAYGGGTWGALKAVNGKSIGWIVPSRSAEPSAAAGSVFIRDAALAKSFIPAAGFKLAPAVSAAPDIPTFHLVGGKTYMLNHFEYPQPSTVYISEISGPDAAGHVSVAGTKPVPDAAQGGFWYMCSASMTPWGTHLAGEEYPPDCRSYEELFLACAPGPKAARELCGLPGDEGPYLQEFMRYYGLYGNATSKGLGAVDFFGNKAAHEVATKVFSCYNYGASPEITVLPGGKTSAVKWRTIGRVSHELAKVMPNNRTVYTTDDNPNGVFLKFVADKAGDLSSGVLSAAKLTKQSANAKGNPTWFVSWIELARGKQSELDKLARDPAFKFSSMFETADPVGSPPKCPDGFLKVNTPSTRYATAEVGDTKVFMECLKIKKGMEVPAAFFESRRVAGMKGATTQFEKKEGITYDAGTRRVYFTVSRILKGMTDDVKHSYAGPKDIILKPNKCGGIIAMDVDKDYSGTAVELLIVGNTDANTDEKNECNVDAISEPDNLIALAGNLIIDEDAHSHANNVQWAYNLADSKLTRILSAVQGAELSGIWANVVGDRVYLTAAVQHPFELEAEAAMGDVTADQLERFRGYLGYIGPLPKSVLDPRAKLSFDGIPVAKGKDMDVMVSTKRACVTL